MAHRRQPTTAMAFGCMALALITSCSGQSSRDAPETPERPIQETTTTAPPDQSETAASSGDSPLVGEPVDPPAVEAETESNATPPEAGEYVPSDTGAMELWDDQGCVSAEVVSTILELQQPYEPAVVLPDASFSSYGSFYCGYEKGVPGYADGAPFDRLNYMLAMNGPESDKYSAVRYLTNGVQLDTSGIGEAWSHNGDYLYMDDNFTFVFRVAYGNGANPVRDEAVVALFHRISQEWANATGY